MSYYLNKMLSWRLRPILGERLKQKVLNFQVYILGRQKGAMEGPTPVSHKIHAATMVTAGVYL
jgi:hypothetical protein